MFIWQFHAFSRPHGSRPSWKWSEGDLLKDLPVIWEQSPARKSPKRPFKGTPPPQQRTFTQKSSNESNLGIFQYPWHHPATPGDPKQPGTFPQQPRGALLRRFYLCASSMKDVLFDVAAERICRTKHTNFTRNITIYRKPPTDSHSLTTPTCFFAIFPLFCVQFERNSDGKIARKLYALQFRNLDHLELITLMLFTQNRWVFQKSAVLAGI